jgi:hypothetical protein
MKEPTIQEVLELVSFERDANGTLYLIGVRGSVWGNVEGNVRGDVGGNIGGHVFGNIEGNVFGIVGRDICGPVNGDVCGTIKGRYWQFVETPKEKAIRLIEEGRGEEAIQVLQEGE